MTGTELFDIYRRTLAVVFGSYTVFRTASFAWNWHAATLRAGRGEAILRRYLYATVLRLRFRRFWPLLLQIFALAVIFVYLLGLIARRSHPAAAGSDAAIVTTGQTTDVPGEGPAP